LKSPDQPLKEPSGLESETNWGPKTAETPEVETYPLTDIESLINVAPDAPNSIRRRTLDLIKRKAQAFGFDDRIGEHPAKARIPLHDNAIPISLPMYSASPAKRIVITHKEKVDTILSLARPRNVANLRTFLGMAVYFSHFIPYYSDLAAPLFQLLSKAQIWRWDAEHERAFEEIKRALATAPVLAHPIPGRPYRLYSDTSNVAIGITLQQVQPITIRDLRNTRLHATLSRAFKESAPIPSTVPRISKKIDDIPPTEEWAVNFEDTIIQVEHVIGYWSRTLRLAEQHYSTTEQEALGVKEGLVKFQAIIEGEKVICITDHAALQWAHTYENSNRWLASWGVIYGSYPGLEIVHRAGRVHSNVDALSRLQRSPMHHSPHDPDTSSLKSSLPQQIPYMWSSITERIPSERIALISTCSRRHRKKEGTEEAESERTDLVPTNLEDQAKKEMEKARENRLHKRNPPHFNQQPGHLHIVMLSARKLKFVEGYQQDPLLRKAWSEAPDVGSPLTAERRYYNNSSGLLFFRDADWVARVASQKQKSTSCYAILRSLQPKQPMLALLASI
jgi:hypothetical protein